MDAALPRLFNLDVLTALGAEKVEAQFDWLKRMPFVQERNEGWIYHSVVRDQMLRYEFRKSPQEWAEMHARLADYYEKLRGQLGLDEKKGWLDATWQRHALEILYHRLCQAPHVHLPRALNDFVRALMSGLALGRRWAETVQQAGREAGRDAEEAGVKSWGALLVEAVKAYDEDRYPDAAKYFTRLLGEAPLENDLRAEALDWRGVAYGRAKEYEKALADFSEATRLAPESEEYRLHRGNANVSLWRADEAMSDFNYVIEQNPDGRTALGFRSAMHIMMGNLDEALKDINRFHELAPDDVDGLIQRARLYILIGEYDKALEDINRCEAINPEHVLVPSIKVGALLQKGDLEQAVKVYALMAENAPKYIKKLREIVASAPAQILERDTQPFSAKFGLDQNKVVADLLRLAAENEENGIRRLRAEAAAIEGLYQAQSGKLDAALAAYAKAAEFDPKNPDYWIPQGGIHQHRGEFVEAVACFTGALELDADNVAALMRRWQVYAAVGDLPAALADIDHLIRLQPDNLLLLSWRLNVLKQMSDLEESVKTLRRMGERAQEFVQQAAASLPPAAPPDAQTPSQPPAEQSAASAQQTRFLEALRNDQDEAVRLLLAEVIDGEGNLHYAEGELEQALEDYTKAIELDNVTPFYVLKRGLVNGLLKRFPEAVEDLARVPYAVAQEAELPTLRARFYQILGRHDEALSDLDRTAQANPEDDFSRYLRAISYRQLAREGEWRQELAASVERATRRRQEEPENRANVFHLALYRLFAGEEEEAGRLYKEGLGDGVQPSDVQEAVYDLECFLEIFRAHARATEMLDVLRDYLRAGYAQQPDQTAAGDAPAPLGA